MDGPEKIVQEGASYAAYQLEVPFSRISFVFFVLYCINKSKFETGSISAVFIPGQSYALSRLQAEIENCKFFVCIAANFIRNGK